MGLCEAYAAEHDRTRVFGEALEAFHANGWTDLVILHLASQHAWRALVARAFPAA